jgi:hypothetical protein
MPGALEDIRVIDFTHALNGPFCHTPIWARRSSRSEPPRATASPSWMLPGKIDAYEFCGST